MKKLVVFTMCVIAVALFSVDLVAQGGNNLKSGSGFTRLYRSGTIENINGTVQAVKSLIPLNSNHEWQIVILKTDENSIPVYVAPVWYLNIEGFCIKENDIIKVKGSRVLIDGGTAIIAGEIQVGNDLLELRNENGIAAWQGSGRR